jgi:hypothetical protein
VRFWALGCLALGAAMLGATAAGAYDDLSDPMAEMATTEDVIKPSAEHMFFHDKRYGAFVCPAVSCGVRSPMILIWRYTVLSQQAANQWLTNYTVICSSAECAP